MSALVIGTNPGCILSPPLTPTPPEENLPPFVDEVDPPEAIRLVTSGDTIDFTVLAVDPNDEDELFYAWLGELSGVIQTGSVRTTGTQDLKDGVFHTFESIELRLDPCNPGLRGLERETLWIYVADRPINISVGSSRVETEEGGYVAVRSWVLNFRPGICF